MYFFETIVRIRVLQQIDGRLKSARKGYSMLKKKSDALNMRFRTILKDIKEVCIITLTLFSNQIFVIFFATQTKENMPNDFRTASLSLAEAKRDGDISFNIMDTIRNAGTKVRLRTDNVAGVTLPIFEEKIDDALQTTVSNITQGGEQIAKCKQTYQELLKDLIKLASLQTSFVTLDAAIKVTNRRVNALEKVVQPKLENTISYIKSELDELDREEIYRLKKIKSKKDKEKKIKEQQLKDQLGAEAVEELKRQELQIEQGASVIEEEQDDDIVV